MGSLSADNRALMTSRTKWWVLGVVLGVSAIAGAAGLTVQRRNAQQEAERQRGKPALEFSRTDIVGLAEERLLELELCDEAGDSSSSLSIASNLRLRNGVPMGDANRCFEGVEGSEGGGLGRVCSGMRL